MTAPSTISRGFSMIEVMVTIVVVAFGLLGLASLVMRGLQAGADSQNRTNAVKQTYDMADRMRANQPGVKAGSYNAITASTSCNTLLAAITNGTEPIVAPTTNKPSCSGTGVDYDTNCWHRDNIQQLPNGAGAVCKGSGNWYAIIVSWNENREANGNNRSFWITFQP